MFCKKCGTEQKDGQKFCPKCGEPFLDENGKPYKYEGIMLSDSVATCAGAVFGTSTVTTFVESGSGVAAGGTVVGASWEQSVQKGSAGPRLCGEDWYGSGMVG